VTAATRPTEEQLTVDVDLLRRSQFFSALDEHALADLAFVTQAQAFHAGTLISETARFPDGVYVVAWGRVHCYRLSRAGSLATLCILHRGELFTEPRSITTHSGSPVALPEGQPRLNAYFQAVRDVIVYCIPKQRVQQLVSTDPCARAAWARLQDGWLSDLYNRLEELAGLDVPRRLAHTLARLAAAGDGHSVRETHQELAWLVGASRETVTKELNKLRRLALVQYEHHHNGIRVTDVERLHAL
jgi:CRP/FNR family transcriptional regulator